MPDIALAVLIFGPLVLTYFLKSNAALGFLALCAGFVLSTSVIGNLKHLLSETNLSVTNDTLGLILLLVPLVGTLLLTRRTHSKGVGLLLQLAAALAAGGLLALSAGPLLATSSQFNVTSSSFWMDLQNIQAGIIGVGAFISLVLIWFASSKHPKKH